MYSRKQIEKLADFAEPQRNRSDPGPAASDPMPDALWQSLLDDRARPESRSGNSDSTHMTPDQIAEAQKLGQPLQVFICAQNRPNWDDSKGGPSETEEEIAA
jgi:hypothetical protein